MGPQFVDHDADGHIDIVTATFEGHAFLVRGSKDGWQEPVHLRDRKGAPIGIGLYYDMEANEYRHVGQGDDEEVDYERPHCISAVAFDWDADGDHDLLLGSKAGGLYLRLNDGTNAEPVYVTSNLRVTAGSAPLEVPGGLTWPKLVDWNADGKTDLVCGSFNGGVYLYRNVGRDGEPAFAKAETLVKPGESTTDRTRPEEGAYAEVLDHDGDGDLDLVVGGYHQFTPEPRELTAEEQTRLAALDEESKRLSAEVAEHTAAIQKAYEESADAETMERLQKELSENEEYLAVSKRFSEVRRKIGELRPMPKRVSGIWLYRQETVRTADASSR